MEYNPVSIETKWKQIWRDTDIYKVEIDKTKPKYYVLDMFPYPSGAGLHVGHPLGYIATDIYSRFKRHKGYNVLHPMGYDAFGLPAEQYAIQTGVRPQVSTDQNIKRYREQLDNLSFSYDWSREVRTCDPSYYKWTQWIFLQLFDHYFNLDQHKAFPIQHLIRCFEQKGSHAASAANDYEGSFTEIEWVAFSPKEKNDILMHYRLAYKGKAYVNWCEELGTVLANDEVKDGVSERGGYPVVKKAMEQWFLRITAYAERLLNEMQRLEWSDALKAMQANWIGRSEGAQIFFKILNTDAQIEIFTTRPDTIFGTTFMVVAPEHDLVNSLTTNEQKIEVERYINYVKTRSDRERMSETKQVTGVFTGAYVEHPFTKEALPIWISEYVLKDYGSGAIMAVPAGDLRDKAFAEKFDLPIIEIIDRTDFPKAEIEDKLGKMIHSDFLDGLDVQEAIRVAISWIVERGLGKAKVNYKLRDANFSRQRYWGEPFPIKYDADGVCYPLDESELPLVLPELDDFKPGEFGQSPLSRLKSWVEMPGGFKRETDTMPGFAGSSWYFLRYMDNQNDDDFAGKEAIEYWQNVDLYVGGTEHAVGHLMYSRFWHKFLFDIGKVYTTEPFKKLINQGMIQGRSNFVYRAKEEYFEAFVKLEILDNYFPEMPVKRLSKGDFEEDHYADWGFENNNFEIEVVSGKLADKIERIKKAVLKNGKRLLVLTNEYLALHINEPEIIADSIRKALDGNENFYLNEIHNESIQLYVSYNLIDKYSPDCFNKIHVDVNSVTNDCANINKFQCSAQFKDAYFKMDKSNNFTCSWEVEKMSKSKYNVVNPDDIVAKYGADCFRMYEMFLGPIDQAKPWDTQGIDGVAKFLRKLWSLFFDESGVLQLTNETPTNEELKILHQCIKKVTEDIERFSFNTCVSAFMVCVNELKRIKSNNISILKEVLVLLSPFAPHIAEELWLQAGSQFSVTKQSYPIANESYLVEDVIDYPVCINGKKRAILSLPNDIDQHTAKDKALQMPEVIKWLEGATPKKVVVVPGKMINVVV